MKTRKLVRDLPHYFSLVGLFTAAFVAFFVFSYDRNFQLAIAIATSIGYVVWGVVHHAIHRDLYIVVVFEYLAMALLGLVLILSTVYR